MVVAWSDRESSNSENDEEQVANICLVAKGAHDNKNEYESSDEVDTLLLYEYSKDELINALINFADLEKKYLRKYRHLKKSV